MNEYEWLSSDLCAVQIGTGPKPPRITDPHDVVAFLRKFVDARSLVAEVFCVVTVNAKNVPVSFAVVSKGGATGAGVDLTILFKYVLLSPGGVGLFVVHNHPSGGEARPSPEDIALTKRIAEGARALGLHLLDHVILTTDSYFSFVESLGTVDPR